MPVPFPLFVLVAKNRGNFLRLGGKTLSGLADFSRRFLNTRWGVRGFIPDREYQSRWAENHHGISPSVGDIFPIGNIS